jgi:hypothetical protein
MRSRISKFDVREHRSSEDFVVETNKGTDFQVLTIMQVSA